MTRFRLRYQAIDVDLKTGEFVVGRNPDCDLVLDDSRVSRRHAAFRISGDGVSVVDLGSRNGVRVNGEKISAPTPLKHGDRTRIGSQELELRDTGKREEVTVGAPDTRTVELRVCPNCAAPMDSDETECPHCNTGADRTTETSGKAPPTDGGLPARPKGQLTASSVNLITNIVEKALTMGQFDEAERLVSGIMGNIVSEAEKGLSFDEREIDATTRYALRIAAATLRPQWIDTVFRLYTVTRRVMPAETIDTLYNLVNTLRYSNTVPLRSYLAHLRARAGTFGPSERFLLQRVEGLERLVLSK